MKTMKKIMLSLFFVLALFTSFSFTVGAQDMISIPKWGGGTIKYRGTNVDIKMPAQYIERDSNFRAVWVSNVVNDISKYTDEALYKSEMMRVFDTIEYYNMNAIVFHIRTHHDAMYRSELNRLSPNYHGVDFDEFDPLEWIIAESKRRGIEFHAWMNPYRIVSVSNGPKEAVAASFPASNPASKVENLLSGAQNFILDPGRPEVKQFLTDTVMEVIMNYDVDAIHFDDYFYENSVDDSDTRAIYNTEGLSVENFRRKQVDDLIEDLHENISNYNLDYGKNIQLGISPSGVYQNGSTGYVPLENYRYNSDGTIQYPLSSNTTSAFAHYGGYLYADTLKWANNGWIDYIVPQVYWSFDQSVAPFGDITEWWSGALKNTNVNLYIGTALYTAGGASSPGWTNDPREMANELQFASGLESVHGQVIFSFKQLYESIKNTNGLYHENMKNVKEEMWYKPALLPEIRSMEPINLGGVKNLKLSITPKGYRIDFDGMDQAKTYAIYRSSQPLTYDVSELVDVIGKKEIDGVISYLDQVDPRDNYFYGVKAVSETNTPGQGVSESTVNVPEGELIPVGKLPDILVGDTTFHNTDVQVRWESVLPNFGSEVEYTIYRSTDNENFSINNRTISNLGNVYTTNIYLGSTEKLYFYLNVKNEISNQNSEVFEIDVSNNIGPILNFTVAGNPIAGEAIVFKWNTIATSEDVTYTVQTSSNQLVWRDLIGDVTIEDRTGTFLYTLPAKHSNNYYRVVGLSESGKALSTILHIEAFEEIPGLNLEFLGKEISGPIYVNANSSVEIIWDMLTHISGEVNYRALMSVDYTNWELARTFHSSNNLRFYHDELQMGHVFTGTFEYYVYYVKIEAFTTTAKTTSEVFEIRVIPNGMLTQIFYKNYFHHHDSIVNKTGIFK